VSQAVGADHASEAEQAFAMLREAGVLNATLTRRLVRAEKARSRVEHSYIDTPAGDVHRAAQLIRDAARSFTAAYGPWVAPYLTDRAG
jgi:hypothetical protein